ncbi:MAG TPA: MFS transporter [Candidatus Saccharimonadales bacterium]|nr:MFS transporter [Candidatus Saccharimonadales bacterium]
MAKAAVGEGSNQSGTSIILPLALAQFICSFAATNMNVAISSISHDLGTTVLGVQTAITLFTLVMAALMIPGSKLTDIWGRKFCLILGLSIYGVGAVLGALALQLGLLIVGYSIFEGVGSALLIPPVYILTTVLFTSVTERAKNFGIISAAAGIGAAAGPLIGGLITSAISWRASFLLQALVVAYVIYLGLKLHDPGLEGERPKFDLGGAVLSAIGLVMIVIGILLSRSYGWFKSRADFDLFGTTIVHQGSLSPVWLFIAVGAVFLVWFFRHIRRREREGKEPLLSTSLFHNHVSNAGLVTQLVQWLTIQGSFFVTSVFLQTVRGYSAVETGLIITPATVGILLTSAMAGRFARRRPQAQLIRWGFLVTIAGLLLLLLLVRASSGIWTFIPGLFVAGVGLGVMLTSSVNVVQSSFSENQQGEISGLSRSVSNLGSSLGTALAGSVLVSPLIIGNKHFALALLVLLAADVLGLLAAFRIPARITAE